MISARATAAAGQLSRQVASTMLLTSLVAGMVSLLPASQDAFAAPQGAASISAGNSDSCVIESGKAYCWGRNDSGQLGDGTASDSAVPVPVDTSGVLAGKTLTQITVGVNHTCALDSTGAAYCWGDNEFGELGTNIPVQSTVPVAVDTSGVLAGKALTQITAGEQETCAVDASGAAYCWGLNSYGQLGDGSVAYDSFVPVAVDTSGVLGDKTLTQVTAGWTDACALDTTGAAYCWGLNTFGQLGDGSTAESNVPVAVDTSGVLAGNALTQISAGTQSTCALDSIGTAYCWGDNEFGELGDGTTTSSSVPITVNTGGVLAGKALTQITAANGGSYTCSLDAAGAAYCWGYNGLGQLGDGTTADSFVPVAVDTSDVLAGKTLTQIAAGGGHTCALDTAAAAYCWGWNPFGELGGDSTTSSDVPVLAGPQAPGGVTAVPSDTAATVSWFAPASLDGGTLTGYTATASPGGATCGTTGATTCTITGLTNETAYRITVVAHTTVGDSGASAPATVTPTGGLAFTSASAYTAAYGAPFIFTVTTTGSPAPAITRAGRLPSGVRFTDNQDGTATISATPGGAASGVYPLILTAKNSYGTATQAFTLTVTRAPAIQKIRTIRTRVGALLRLTIQASGYPAPALSESGALPGGLTFTDNSDGTATIAGTVTAGSVGQYPINIAATNASGTATQHFTIVVLQRRMQP
jgi:alpha-tubulin suppressor-like RCC1 family protein